MKGISHYGIYREKFQEATEMEIAWFDGYLKDGEGSNDSQAP